MGKNMDAVVTESGLISQFPESGPQVLWRQAIGPGFAGPSVVGEHLFVMDRTADAGKGIEVENAIKKAGQIAGGERVQCLNINTGEQVWSHTYDCPYMIAYPTGPRTTPTVDGEHVYTLGAMGHLICFKSESGQVVWEKDLANLYSTKPPPWGFSSHPLVDRKLLIVPVGGSGSGVVAFDKLTGEEVWKSVTTKDVGYAPLVIFDKDAKGDTGRQLIFWHADGVTSLNPATGEEYWTVKFPEEPNPSQTTIATPRIVGNRIFISEFYKGSLLLEVGSNPPSVKENYRTSQTDPRSEHSLNAMMATPVVKDGLVYGVGYDGRGNGVLRCIELESGEMKWARPDWLSEKPLMFSTGFFIENGDKFYVFDDLGELMIARLSQAGFDVLDRAKLLEPTSTARGRQVVWSHPAIANGRFYARNDEEIICVNLKDQ
jgi:outer membrane protein assembly factor BamB